MVNEHKAKDVQGQGPSNINLSLFVGFSDVYRAFEAFPSIGESLFTIFASLAQAIQFLMELQINQLCVLKGHSTINPANEYEPDVLNTFCATQV